MLPPPVISVPKVGSSTTCIISLSIRTSIEKRSPMRTVSGFSVARTTGAAARTPGIPAANASNRHDSMTALFIISY